MTKGLNLMQLADVGRRDLPWKMTVMATITTISDLHAALVTASQQDDLANRRILALEAELELARQQVGNMEAQLLLVAEAEDKDGSNAIERVLKDLAEQTVSRPNRQRLREGLDKADAGDALRRAIGS